MSEFKEELQEDVKTSEGITLQDKAFLDVLFDHCGGSIRKAMDHVGFKKDVPTSVITSRLNKQIKERTKEYLISNTGLAAYNLVNVIIDPTALGAKNVIAAAQQVLDRGGVFKEEDLNKTIERNIFILPAIQRDEDI